MRFYIEFDEKENLIYAAPQIVKQLSVLRGLEEAETNFGVRAPKFNLYNCLGNKLFLDKEGHWKMEFLPEFID